MKPRDRIIELLQDVQYLGGLELRIADHLLANGVTVGGEWISVADRLPKPEEEVLICYKSPSGKYVTTAIYEDGNIHTDESIWCWYEIDDSFTYCEETDDYIIAEGWFEYKHFLEDDEYNHVVDYPVTHWMPLPKPPKEG